MILRVARMTGMLGMLVLLWLTPVGVRAQGDDGPGGALPQVGEAKPIRPTAMVTAPYAPLDWAGVNADWTEYGRLLAATRAMVADRDALVARWQQRRLADAARRGNVDVLLDLREALVTCANAQVRPTPGRASVWSDMAGRNMSRIQGGTQEFTRGREDVRMLFQQRGGAWAPPQLGMLTNKFLQAFHPKGCEGTTFTWTDRAFSGAFALASSGGDRRYQMHHSGEGTTVALPEFRQWKDYGGGWWPDWWLGPRERLGTTTDAFSIAAGQRRGWLLKATLLAERRPTGFLSFDQELYVWVEDGRVMRGYAIVPGKLPGRGPELLVNLDRWSLTDGRLEAAFTLGPDGTATRTWTIRATLPEAESGGFVGEYRQIVEKPDPKTPNTPVRQESAGVVEGTLFRAYCGTYAVTGPDGARTGSALAGVAAVRSDVTAALPEVAIEAGMPAGALFAAAVELARHVAALDWALREYPLPLADALRRVRDGSDDRFRLYPPDVAFMQKATRAAGADRDVPPTVRPHMHEAMAAMLGGPASYVDRLQAVARATVASWMKGVAPAIGIGNPVDPDFGPYGGLRRASSEAGVNALPGTGGAPGGWAALDDWTCHGFIQRCWAFDTGPYLPELPIVPGLRPGGQPLEPGKPVRIAYPDRGEHLWAWRTRADPDDGAVTIPRECLLLTKSPESRNRWAGSDGAGVREEALDFYYNRFVTWYATTAVRSDVPRRVWMAARINWDGRVWVNDQLVWRPSREHSPEQVAVFPVDLVAGVNRVTVCCSARPVGDGNNGNSGAYTYKYGERAYGAFTLWVAGGVEPRTAQAVAAARQREAAADRASAAEWAARAVRGRRGDGSGVYPDANPPLAWDIARGTNIRWTAAIPTDDAEPVAVGNRLFVTTYTGELACLDVETGAVLWRKAPAGVAPAGGYPPPAITASFGQQAYMWRTGVPTTLKPHESYARACLTPVADARRVWMQDPRGAVVCFAHDGTQMWAKAVAAQTPRFTEGGYVKQRVLPPTHPAAVGSRLIVAVGNGIAAFDLERGDMVWERPTLDYLGQFAAMAPVDGGSALVLLSSGEVLDADTGRTLIARCAPLIPDAACEPVVSGRTAYFGACSTGVRFWRDPAGVLCSRVLWHSPTDITRRQHDMSHSNGDSRSELRFFSKSAAHPPTPVLKDGLLYEHMGEQMSIGHGPQQSMRLHTWDAATGCAVSQRYGLQLNATHPVSSTVIAGGYVFCADEGGVGLGDYPGFPEEPSIVIVTAEEQPRRVTRWQPGLATMSPPTFQGDCMFLAGEDQVVCVGRPKDRADRLTDCEVAALRDTLFALEVGARPAVGGAGRMTIAPPERFAPGDGTPIAPLVSARTPQGWLFAGPFFVDETTDVFADQGGAAMVYPRPGQTVRYTRANGAPADAAFVVLDPNYSTYDRKTARASFDSTRYIIGADYAKALGDMRLTGGINFATASGRQYNTTCYAYTVLEVPRAGLYRVETMAGRIKNSDVYLAGTRIEGGTDIQLAAGRYPLMVRAAIGLCGNWEPIQWAIQFVALPNAAPGPPPAPVAEPLPAGLRLPVAPLLPGSLPPRMLGAWPLARGIDGNPYDRMQGQTGTLVAEGTRVTQDGQTVEFRPVPAGAIIPCSGAGISDWSQFNIQASTLYQSSADKLGLVERRLFPDAAPATGLFFAVLSNPRPLFVEARFDPNVRCWLSGREVHAYEKLTLKPGLYPFLLEYRADERTNRPVAPIEFVPVPDPTAQDATWVVRVRRSEDLLRRIAATGAAGDYAREALDAAVAGNAAR